MCKPITNPSDTDLPEEKLKMCILPGMKPSGRSKPLGMLKIEIVKCGQGEVCVDPPRMNAILGRKLG